MTPLNVALHNWTLGQPGTFQADTHDGVLALVHRESKIHCSVHEFAAELKRCGIEPSQRSNPDTGGYSYILAFAGRGITRTP